ncbi:MAG TPA: glycine--tRNA ligase subunit beta [Acidobacteriota bacterium]|nr:glycine--tRNA ligase subunit beta [Acidobacteriota bacterium]
MEKSELVVELGVEEIPASMIEDAARQLAEILVESLKTQRLPVGTVDRLYTPRRIIAAIRDIPVCQEDLVESIVGPPKSVAYDSAGNPTRAALAFAQKNGVTASQLKFVQTPKGEYLSIERKVRGMKTHKLLEALLPSAIAKIQFPKTMHWTADNFRFVRPLRWIVALFGGKCVRFKIADIASSKFTVGHRFLGKSRIAVSSYDSLKNALRENSVLVDPQERLVRINAELLREAEACGGRLLEDPELLKTVVNLNEMPSVIRGSFEQRFLSLPSEILITVMREHQKYFCVMNGKGELLPVFLAVVNLQSDAKGLIRVGHERVLRARLADAAFFWDTDRKTPLGDREPSLKSVLFQEKLGSYFDKTQRLLALLPKVTPILGKGDLLADLERAAHLCKCDLITEMVKEFTDLQGVVGGLYARAEGFPETVWRAVYEQYSPKSSTAASPTSDTGAILALLDRLDTVCGCFCVGLIPSGSGDPFAVRRQGNGILKIVFDHRLSVSLDSLIDWSLQTYGRGSDQTAGELREFFEGRLRFLFEEMGFSYDCVNAILAAGFDDPLDALERLRALQAMREAPDFLSLASNFKRIVNIVSQAAQDGGELQEALLQEPAERALWQGYLRILPEVQAARKSHDYGAALRALASVRVVVDEFFKEVMVMAEDAAIRRNRVALLTRISRLFISVADISRIVIERSA